MSDEDDYWRHVSEVMNRPLAGPVREQARQKAVECFVRAAESMLRPDTTNCTSAMIWGAIALIYVSKIGGGSVHAAVQKVLDNISKDKESS
jgi:hypothetical protein